MSSLIGREAHYMEVGMGTVTDLNKFKNSWKLRLRYGKIKTNLKPYVVITDCENSEGMAFISVQMWVENRESAIEFACYEAESRGYCPIKCQIYDKPDIEFPVPKKASVVGDIKIHPYE
jgi:hypothetical protein